MEDIQLAQRASIRAGCFTAVQISLVPLTCVMSLGFPGPPCHPPFLPFPPALRSTNSKFYQQPQHTYPHLLIQAFLKGSLLPEKNSPTSYYDDTFLILLHIMKCVEV